MNLNPDEGLSGNEVSPDAQKEVAYSRHPEPRPDAWSELKQFTAARIALGSTGISVPVKEVLQFRLAHAHARDAVFSQIDQRSIREAISDYALAAISLTSRATNRQEYLQRPDLGRLLDEASAASLRRQAKGDIVVVIADGLSAEAVNRHAMPLLARLLPGFENLGLTLAPVCIVTQGRVAIGDEIGEELQTRLSLVMIGERPGLSSPDSLGVYITFGPRRGLTDEARNCVSNIRPEGLDYDAAAGKILYLISEAFRRRLTGIQLKDETFRLPG